MVNLKSKLKQVQKQRGALLLYLFQLTLQIYHRRAACDESGDHSPVPDIVLGNHSYVPAIKRRLFPSCEDQLDGE